MTTFPLAMPSHNFRRFEMGMLNVVGRSVSPFTLREQQFAWDGAKWLASVTLPQLTRTQADDWLAFLAALRGTEGTFLLGDPFRFTQRGSLAMVDAEIGVQINEDAPAGHTIATRGWTPSATGVLLPGDMFQVGYGEFARLYMVTAAVDADAGGLASIEIWPKWRQNLSAFTPLEQLNDPGFEAWTGGVLDDWSDNAEPGTTFLEASTTPLPFAGARYLEMVKTSGGFASVAQSGNMLQRGMPYRYRVQRGKNTTNALKQLSHFLINSTAAERLWTKRWSGQAAAAAGDVWVPNASGGSAAIVGGAVADTWYRTEFGVHVPTKYADTDGWTYMLGTTSATGTSVYYDAASLWGPSYDGMALEFSNPKGVFRLRSNDRGWTMPTLTTYGIGFEAEEALGLL